MSELNHWNAFYNEQRQCPYFNELVASIAQQREQGIEIYPEDHKIYAALEFVDLDQIKVVILGQDPYHGPGQAQGMAFSVADFIKVPPSLNNIYKELAQDIRDFTTPEHGDLTQWAEQGVLLINTVLTVQKGLAHSHAKLGWEIFSDALIRKISAVNSHCVFMLWGAHAHSKEVGVNADKHLILKSVHPSPLSAYRGFLGCGHFSAANQWLEQQAVGGIDWKITDRGSLSLF